MSGSANWAEGASQNSENCALMPEAQAIAAYEHRFNELWGASIEPKSSDKGSDAPLPVSLETMLEKLNLFGSSIQGASTILCLSFIYSWRVSPFCLIGAKKIPIGNLFPHCLLEPTMKKDNTPPDIDASEEKTKTEIAQSNIDAAKLAPKSISKRSLSAWLKVESYLREAEDRERVKKIWGKTGAA